jgi:hypothetical protein
MKPTSVTIIMLETRVIHVAHTAGLGAPKGSDAGAPNGDAAGACHIYERIDEIHKSMSEATRAKFHHCDCNTMTRFLHFTNPGCTYGRPRCTKGIRCGGAERRRSGRSLCEVHITLKLTHMVTSRQ